VHPTARTLDVKSSVFGAQLTGWDALLLVKEDDRWWVAARQNTLVPS
jgi:hypothetical protein